MVLLCLLCDRVACYILNGNSVCDAEKCLDTATAPGERILHHKRYLKSLQEDS